MYLCNKRNKLKVFYGGNVYVANEKVQVRNRRRNWKCSMYYKEKCKARVTITPSGQLDVPVVTHTHPPLGHSIPGDHTLIDRDCDLSAFFS